jgi:hypothetical protein
MARNLKLTPEQLRLAVLAGILIIVGGVALTQMVGRGGLTEAARSEQAAEYETRDLPKLADVRSWENGEVEALTSRNPFTFGAPPTPTRNLTPPPAADPAAAADPDAAGLHGGGRQRQGPAAAVPA